MKAPQFVGHSASDFAVEPDSIDDANEHEVLAERDTQIADEYELEQRREADIASAYDEGDSNESLGLQQGIQRP